MAKLIIYRFGTSICYITAGCLVSKFEFPNPTSLVAFGLILIGGNFFSLYTQELLKLEGPND